MRFARALPIVRHVRALFWRRVWLKAHKRKQHWRMMDFLMATFSDDPEVHKKHGFTVIAKAGP